MLLWFVLLVLVFSAPMGPGKVAGKGRADFDVKAFVAGEYTATLRMGFEEVKKTYQCELKLTNGTSSGIIEEVLISGEGNETTTEVLQTYKLDLEIINKTSIDVKLKDKFFFTLVFEVDNKTGSIEAHAKTPFGDKAAVSIINGNYFTIQVLQKDAGLMNYAISKKKVQQRAPVWQRLLSPAMMLISMFVSQRMKKMQMATAPAPQGVDYPINNAAAAATEPEPNTEQTADEAPATNREVSQDAAEAEEQDVE